MKTFALATVGLTLTEQRFAHAMLELGRSKLPCMWVMTNDPTKADAILVDIDHEEGLSFWQASLQKHNLIAFCTRESNAETGEWCLQKPLGVDKLVALLSRFSRKSADTNPPVTSSSNVSPYYPNGSFAAYLKKICEQAESVMVNTAGLHPIYLSPTTNCYYMSVMHANAVVASLRILCTTQVTQLKSQNLTEQELGLIVRKQGLKASPFQALIWTAALYAISTQHLPDIAEDTKISLKSWPNFTRLPHQPEHVTLAALMRRRTATLSEFVKESRLSVHSVNSFCNACLALDLIAVGNTRSIGSGSRNAPEITPQKQTLFRKIMDSLHLSGHEK